MEARPETRPAVQAWLRRPGRPLVLGHKGASAYAPENTLRAIEQALASGADGVEIDVVALADGTLVLGHSLSLAELCHGAGSGRAGALGLQELRSLDPDLATLEEALELIAASGSCRCLLDLKEEGYEERVAARVRAHGLLGRTLACSLSRRSLRLLAAQAPGLHLSISYPRDRFEASRRSLLAPLVPVALAGMRATLGLRIGRWLSELGASAATLHHMLVTPAVVGRCHIRGAAVIAWAIDGGEQPELARLTAAGADGIICNDPGLVTRTLP
jgi:glycerophosphoryl diester phosphodiesterase